MSPAEGEAEARRRRLERGETSPARLFLMSFLWIAMTQYLKKQNKLKKAVDSHPSPFLLFTVFLESAPAVFFR
jgi:hypothetical protein